MQSKDTEKDFDAEHFVERLFDEGGRIPCDETSHSFNENTNLPSFYDEILYERGKIFFNDNIFALLLGKFLGLLTILARPSIVKILIHTKMSGAPFTAYKRYMSTLFHMCIWYKNDFTPRCGMLQSISEVKSKHNFVSKNCNSVGLGRISQRDMALTQFGFMGYAVAKREKIGLHCIKDEDLEGFVHIWRVIGHIMGIEEKFNLCRESVQETTAICVALADKVFRPSVAKKDKEFIEMATHLCHGMWCMQPTLNVKLYLTLAHRLLEESNNNELKFTEPFLPLTFLDKIFVNILVFTIWTLQFTIFRLYHNYTMFMSFWLMKHFPFLAYYSFGYSNAHVRILQNK